MKSNALVPAAFIALLLATGCTPNNIEYCRQFGVEGTPEYGKCLGYYQNQTAAFEADRRVCMLEADQIYPPSLYDYGGYTRTHFGTGWGTPGGYFYGGGGTVFVEPDYRKNAELDRLRMQIIEPCMQNLGWNSGATWQAGRHSVKPRRSSPASRSNEPLPWLR